jgi:hypothetical protein
MINEKGVEIAVKDVLEKKFFQKLNSTLYTYVSMLDEIVMKDSGTATLVVQ